MGLCQNVTTGIVCRAEFFGPVSGLMHHAMHWITVQLLTTVTSARFLPTNNGNREANNSSAASHAGPSPGFSSRGGQKPEGGAKRQKGDHIFKIQYWMYAATGGPNVKWGDTNFKWAEPDTTAPSLATALIARNLI